MSRRRSHSFLPLDQRQLELDAAVLEVQPPRHEREALLGGAAREALDLLAMEQQLARPVRLVVEVRRFLVRRDGEVDQPQLAVAQSREGFVDRDVAAADRLDLAALSARRPPRAIRASRTRTARAGCRATARAPSRRGRPWPRRAPASSSPRGSRHEATLTSGAPRCSSCRAGRARRTSLRRWRAPCRRHARRALRAP